jgi:hypothetical protein
MKRCGNHAIINWLKPHANFIFFNNVVDIAAILRNEKPIPEPLDFREWITQRLVAKRLGILVPLRAATIRHRPLIASLEDHDLAYCPFKEPPCPLQHALFIRDAKNMFASRIHKAFALDHPAYPREPGPLMDRAVELWKSHAREYLGETQVLNHKVCIYFNAWFNNPAYRQGISQQLGFKFTDAGIAQVSTKGGGSSFNNTEFNGNTQAMKVLNRHESLTGPARELFDFVFQDTELGDLNQRVADKSVLP